MGGRVKGECGEEKESGEGTTSIAWTRFGKPAKKGRVETEETEEEMMVMEEAEERKGVSANFILARAYDGRPAAAATAEANKQANKRASEQASSLRNAHARAWMILKFTRGDTRFCTHVWGILANGRRWLTDHH